MSALIRTDSPLLTVVQHGILSAIHACTGWFFPQIIKMPEWKAFLDGIFSEHECACTIAGKRSPGWQFRFAWDPEGWRLLVSDPENPGVLDRKYMFDSGILSPDQLAQGERAPLVFSFREHKAQHKSVDGTETVLDVSHLHTITG